MPERLAFDSTLPYRTIKMEGFNELIGEIWFAQRSDEEWRIWLEIEDRHRNVGGVCHGGVLLTLADIGMGAAAFRAFGMHPVATISMTTQFIAAARPGHRVHGRSQLLRLVKNLAFMECDLWCRERQVIKGTGVFKLLDRTAKGPPDPRGTSE